MTEGGPYCCPACRAATEPEESRYVCTGCGLGFPVLHGIPDFRLNPDPYLSLEDERAKAARLAEFGRDHDFEALVAEYYRITDDVPPEMAARYAAYVHAGETRGGELLPKLRPGPGARLVDLGCGSGGFVAAAARRGHRVAGVDIALRWLVIAKKRLEAAGLDAELVCADVAALPFPEQGFDGAVAADLLEHLPDTAMTAVASALRPGGRAILTAANRYTLAPYPLAGLVGVGYLPAGLRRRYTILRRGLDTLRHATLRSPLGVRRALARAGFTNIEIRALEISADRPLGEWAHRIRPLYASARETPGLRDILVAIGPAFEVSAVKSGPKKEDRQCVLQS